MVLNLIAPWPPSLNQYYRALVSRNSRGSVVARSVVSAEGREYRSKVVSEVGKQVPRGGGFGPDARLSVLAEVRPPATIGGKRWGSRVWDLANREKALFDGLTAAGVWDDDSQVDDLRLVKGEPDGDGSVLLTISEVE